MSRTYKDKPAKFRFPEKYDIYFGCETVPYTSTYKSYRTGEEIEYTRYWHRDLPGAKAKKRKEKDYEWHWMSTPSWWTRMTMNRPTRRTYHLLEHEAARTPVEKLEELDIPDLKKKPHIYYY